MVLGLVTWSTVFGFIRAAIAEPTTQPAPLSLAEARRFAIERNWDLLAARSGVEAATAQQIVAREFPNPQVSITSSQLNLNGHSNATAAGNGVWQRSYDTVIAVNQLLEIGGKRGSRQSLAKAGATSAEARLQDAQRLLENGVTQAYIAAVLVGEKAEILRASMRSLHREASIAESRFRAGEISAADQTQIEIAADRLESDALSAENDAAGARIAVDLLMAANPATGSWTPIDTLSALSNLTAPADTAAVSNRPDLLAARAEVEKAEFELKLQRAQRIPDPTVVVQYEHQPPDFAETLGIGVSFPLPLWNQNRGQIRSSLVARDQALQQQHKLEAQISAEVAATRRNYASALTRLQRQRELIEPKSAQVLHSVSLAYEKGGASLIELLAAERNDAEIRLATAQAAADTATAHALLRAALNVPASHPQSR